MQKKQGIIVYDSRQERMDIRFGLKEYYNGLHCGECLDVLINGEWIHTRIECDNDWYLVGINKGIQLSGLQVKI